MTQPKNRFAWIALTSMILGNVLGCDNDKQLVPLDSGLMNDGGLDASVSPADALQGVWEGACIPGGSDIDGGSDADAGASDATRQGFAFNGNQFVTRIERYFDSTCTTPVLRLEIGGTFTVGDAIDSAQGIYPLNVTISTLTAEVATADLADIANAEALLGFTDWQADVARDVLGRDVFGTGTPIAQGDVIYQIFQLLLVPSGSTTVPVLFLGNEGSAGPILSEAQRPTTLSTAPHAYTGTTGN